MDFLKSHSLVVKRITMAICVHKGTPVHRNRPSHGFAMRVAGSAEFVFENGKVLRAEPNVLVYLPKGSSYTVSSTEGETYAINFELLEEGSFEPFAADVEQIHLMKHFRDAERAWRQDSSGDNAACMAALYEILAALRGEYERAYFARDTRTKIERAERYVAEHFTDSQLRIGEVAAEVGVSEVYLRRLFEGRHGITPIEYIRACRMERACELIAAGDCSMREVAWQSGFDDYSYFCRTFRQKTGLSPTEYAADLKK